MLASADVFSQSLAALRAHRLRAVLTILGLTMGVATLITVMTIVQGANLFVEQKIATLGTDVFQVARTPFTVTDFDVVIKALRYKKIEYEDYLSLASLCQQCEQVGATATASVRVKAGDLDVSDVTMTGSTPNMADIDTRTIGLGRYFTDIEDQHSANVCLIGDTLNEKLFGGGNPVGRQLRIVNDEFTVIGTFEKLGSVLGQDQDNFMVVPLSTFLRIRGARSSLTVNVKRTGGAALLERAQDQVRLQLRARRHLKPGQDDDFFLNTRDSTIALWKSISGAFFAVFVMVSAISAIVGGIVIMNVMLVSVTERTKEIGVRRALGATQTDILRQFLTESVMQCLVGGLIGIGFGFTCALALRTFTSFPAAVQTWVAILGVVLSSVIGLFFGIYPALQASRLDPVVALRGD